VSKLIYVCHPFYGHGKPEKNLELVKTICADIWREGFVPVAPHLSLEHFADEGTERVRILDSCVILLKACSEVRAFRYGGVVTEGMRLEIEAAQAAGICVTFHDF